jgi:hypothetical protein
MLVLAMCTTSASFAREWKDATGKFTIQADLVAVDAEQAVLRKEKDNELLVVKIAELSEADREFLASDEAHEVARAAPEEARTFVSRHGKKIVGQVVDFARKEVTLQRRRGRIYVNDQLYDNLPEPYRSMVPEVVAHFEQTEIDGRAGLQKWILKLKGQPQTYTVDGVMLELESGDIYAIPFFFLSEQDQEALKPGFERWLAARETEETSDDERERLLAESVADTYRQDQAAQQQIGLLQLQMLAVNAGVTSLWEVRLLANAAGTGPYLSVVVPARDSATAKRLALEQHPGYIVGPVRKVN